MPDKIQEIMGLVRSMSDADFYAGECTGRADFAGAAKHEGDASVIERAIESKLRELVREPLSDEHVLSIQERYVGGVCPQYPLDASDWINFARAIECAHNITNTRGESNE